jgi:hypothetical protein
VTLVVHRTPGEIDLQAFTVMGLSAKPSSTNPIGMFGTGLKYAIAVLVRSGAKPVVWIGKDKYVFSVKAGKFRDRDFQKVRMRIEKEGWPKPRYQDLPFTTDYGRFWKMWMAFRELHSNTLDEGGTTFDMPADSEVVGTKGMTTIVVDHTDYFAAFALADETFLPGALREHKGDMVQVMPEENTRLFWRGLRVSDLTKRTVRTWNFLCHLELTEDRTLKNEHVARYHLTRWIAEVCEDEQLIEDVITAGADKWEHRLDFKGWASKPTELFIRVAERNASRAPGVMGYVGRWRPSPPGQTPWERHPRPWTLDEDDSTIRDGLGVAVFMRPYEHPTDWTELAKLVVTKINRGLDGLEPLPQKEESNDDSIPF